MKSFYSLMADQPHWFGKDSPLEKKEQIEFKDKALLCGKDKAGRPIFVAKTGKTRVSDTSPSEQAEIIDYWYELVLDDPQTQAVGACIILDMDGYSWKYFSWFTPSNIKLVVKKINLFPLTDLVVHVVNTSFLLNATIKIIWPFLNDKVQNMLKFHFDNWSSLHEYISADVLPPEYGGNGPEIDFEGSIQVLFDQEAIIAAKLKYRQAFKK